MADQFSDPGWWQHRPQREQATSTSKLILGTLVPTVAIVAVVVFIVIQGGKHSTAGQSERSVVAFTVCMQAHGVTSSTKSGSTKQQLALNDCRSTLPAGTHVGNFGSSRNEDQLAECMQGAGGGRSRGGGGFGRSRFGGGPSQSYLNALSICRTLTQSGEPSLTPPVPATPQSTTPPVA